MNLIRISGNTDKLLRIVALRHSKVIRLILPSSQCVEFHGKRALFSERYQFSYIIYQTQPSPKFAPHIDVLYRHTMHTLQWICVNTKAIWQHFTNTLKCGTTHAFLLLWLTDFSPSAECRIQSHSFILDRNEYRLSFRHKCNEWPVNFMYWTKNETQFISRWLVLFVHI